MKNKGKKHTLRSYLPRERVIEILDRLHLKHPIKTLMRYLRRTRNPIKIIKVKKHQDNLLRENYSANTEKLIIFLTPGYNIVNGGILSISSIYEETTKLRYIHESEVIMCTIPGDPHLLKYTKFNNKNYIYRLPQVLSYFKNLQSLMVHIPEYRCDDFIKNYSKEEYSQIKKIPHLRINIMLQNIELLPNKNSIEKLGKLGELTFTTAHEKYSTYEMKNKLGFPLHKLSVYISPEQYDKKKYIEKENIMIVSPDYHPKKSEVLDLIARQLPQLRIQIIKKLTYEEYKETITKAKWALTFGEGLDGYFIETIFSGGISFSVLNSDFFTNDFETLKTIYNNYDILVEKICLDIKELDNKTDYTRYQMKQYELVSKHYNYNEYINNIKSYYEEQYTYI